ncbi:hypothetical protein HZ326_28886 [Fusarium oxysporum f. sp. albedinis]|nr:hypothetical protein HZ326_28886 [Fusarium oxysporum f. sp. albedinis]
MESIISYEFGSSFVLRTSYSIAVIVAYLRVSEPAILKSAACIPLSTDEHYLEEPIGVVSKTINTQESTVQFWRSWRIGSHTGNSYTWAC